MIFLRMGIMAMLFFMLVYNGAQWRGRQKIEASHEGRRYRGSVRRGKNKAVERITIATELPGNLRFILRREQRFDRFAKTIGIATEWQSGDTEFDEDIFVVCDDARLLRALGADAELRTSCSRLIMRAAGSSLECKGGILYLDVNADQGFGDDTNEEVLQLTLMHVAGMLEDLRGHLLKLARDHWSVERDPQFTRKSWLVGICLALGILGAVALLGDMQNDSRQVVRAAIPTLANGVTVFVILSLVFTVFVWLGRTPHTHGVLLDVFLMALPGCWIASSVAFTWANESLDRSAPQLAPVQVLNAFVTHGRHGRESYHLLARWPDPRGSDDLRITGQEYSWIRSHTCIVAEWHRGRFGDGWVSGYRPDCPGDSEAQVER